MNPIRKLVKKISRVILGSPKIHIKINGMVGIIQPTKIALENNTIDKFNKVITIHNGVELSNDKIIWGKILKEYPYSEEKVKAIKQVHEIPIVERKFDREIEFFQEPDFGSVENII